MFHELCILAPFAINFMLSIAIQMMEHFRREVNQNIRENYINGHKVHLLLLLGHGQHINRLLNSQDLLGIALSIITNKEVYPPKRTDLSYLEKFTRWFTKKITLVEGEPLEKGYWFRPLVKVLTSRFEKKQALTSREFVFMFILISRALGMTVRLVQSLKPLHWRPITNDLFKPAPGKEDASESIITTGVNKIDLKDKLGKCSTKSTKNKMVSSSSEDLSPKASVSSNNVKRVRLSSTESDDSDDPDFHLNVSKNKQRRKSFTPDKSSLSSKSNSCTKISSTNKGNNSAKGSRSKRSLSGDSNDKTLKKQKLEACREWAEVYVEEEERWISIDIVKGKIHCASEIEVSSDT